MSETIQLYDAQGRRLYLTSAERDAFLEAATKADRPIRTLCSVLYYTGCQISEAFALTPCRIDINDQTIILETFKSSHSVPAMELSQNPTVMLIKRFPPTSA